MKKTNLLVSCAICAFTMFLVTSCKKGDTGPAGAAGPAGPSGASGAQGPAGDPGAANVIYSQWDSSATFIPIIQAPDTVGYYADIDAPRIDLNMLNTGEMKVYVKLGNADDPTVFPLPYNDGTIFIDMTFFLNTIEISSNGDLTGVAFRYILIPGGTAARSSKTINWKNYREVQAYLGLKD